MQRQTSGARLERSIALTACSSDSCGEWADPGDHREDERRSAFASRSDAAWRRLSEMTQQYLLGQVSTLLGELQSAAGERTLAVRALRLQVESSPPSAIPRLASDAMTLSDTICWTALERGDAVGFAACAAAAGELLEFASNAELMPFLRATARRDHSHGA